jgi:hypothetical protein
MGTPLLVPVPRNVILRGGYDKTVADYFYPEQ